MNQRYDVFRLDTGGPMWVAALETFEGAKSYAEECAVEHSCDCWVFDQHTGTKHVVKYGE